jgi:integrase
VRPYHHKKLCCATQLRRRPSRGNGFNQANLPHLSAHSLRKGTAAELATEGASPHEIMSVTGHTTLAEAERYTREAEKKKLADRALSKIK